MTTTKRAGTAALVGATLLVLGGCGGDEDGGAASPDPATATLPGSGSTVLVGGATTAVGEERISGRPVNVNGCLGAQDAERTFLVVWPHGTALDDGDVDGLRIDGELLDADSTFVGKGVQIYRQPFPEQFPSIPLRCLGPNQEPIAWVQQIDEIS